MEVRRIENRLIFTIEDGEEAEELRRQLTYAQRYIGCRADVAVEIENAFFILSQWEG